jgi:hypothetical protein
MTCVFVSLVNNEKRHTHFRIVRHPHALGEFYRAHEFTITDFLIFSSVYGRRENPAAQFISQVLGLAETLYDMIEREWINRQLRIGAQAISRCKLHRPPLCSCWASQRGILWQAQSVHGERSPESWAAVRVYEALEDLELCSRPESQANLI